MERICIESMVWCMVMRLDYRGVEYICEGDNVGFFMSDVYIRMSVRRMGL